MNDLDNEIATIQQHRRCLLEPSDVDQLLDNLAQQIAASCADKNPLVLCVMAGAVVATGLLLPRLKFPLELDYIHVTRYQNKIRGGEVEWKQEPQQSLHGRHVLIIDDVLDEGITLQQIVSYCKEKGAAGCMSAVLVNKNIGKKKPITANFIGMETGDDYIYGLGMDYKGYLRNEPGVYACPKNIEELLCQN